MAGKNPKDAGHTYQISDLYADGFHPVMSEAEYLREGFYELNAPVPEDVRKVQEKINAADVIAFIYPDFWTASPAMLEAMKTVMVGARIRNRAKVCEVYAFDQMTRGYGNDENRAGRIEKFSVKAYELGKSL